MDDPRVVLSLDRLELVPFGWASLGLSLQHLIDDVG